MPMRPTPLCSDLSNQRGALANTHSMSTGAANGAIAAATAAISCMKMKFTNRKTMQPYYAEAVVEHYHRTINSESIMIIITRCRNCLYRELLLFTLLPVGLYIRIWRERMGAWMNAAQLNGSSIIAMISVICDTPIVRTHFQQIVRVFVLECYLFVRR